jgi:N-acetylneuraminic acid mutarotase
MKKVYFLGMSLLFLMQNFAFTQTWQFKSPMSISRHATAAAVLNGNIYVVGGSSTSTNSLQNICEKYDPVNDTWQIMAPMSVSRCELGLATVNGKMYAIGGTNPIISPSGRLDIVEEYDPSTNTWTTKASMPTPRSCVSVTVINNLIYCTGGWPNGFSTCEIYNPATNSWTTASSMNVGRVSTNAFVTVGNQGFKIGGKNTGGVLSSCEKFNPSTNTWTFISNLPQQRWSGAAISKNGKVYFTGGSSAMSYNPTNTNFEYDPVSDIWTASVPMQIGRCGHSGVSLNDKIYVFGGQDSVNSLSSVEVLSACSFFDTVNVVIYDTIRTTVVDTNYVTIYDTVTVTTYDTITTSIAVTDTLIINAVLSGVNPPNNTNTLQVYPNPARTHITIDNGNFALMNGYTVRINNTLGQTVFSQAVNQQQFFIDLSGWTGSGLYYLDLLDPQGNSIARKVIVVE